jgi:agmatine deiminase
MEIKRARASLLHNHTRESRLMNQYTDSRAPLESVTHLQGSAAAQGWRMPAEWEPLDAVWLVRPHNAETWPGCLAQAQAEWDAWKLALEEVVRVRTTDEIGAPTNDSWIRDFGAIFVTHATKGVAAHSFIFNGWGGKYEARTDDDSVPEHMVSHLRVPLWSHNFVLEGGSIDVDGEGTMLTTEQCLSNDNRNPDASPQAIEKALRDAFAVEQLIWLPGGIKGDDTDGHIDDIARFVRPGVVAAVRAPHGHADHEILEANWKVLTSARTAKGRKLDVVALPTPDALHYDFPADRFGAGGRNMLPASHANFLIANGRVFVPCFGGKSDDVACRLLAELTGKTAVAISARHLVVGLGSLHCLSQQQPADPRVTAACVASRA